MSTISTRQSKVKPVVVEVAIRNAIARRMRDHGIAQFDTIADEVVLDLFGTRIVPTPEGVPSGFLYQGTHLDWPQGVDTRAVTAEEARTYTHLFSLPWEDGLKEGESLSPVKITDTDVVRTLRSMYEVLWNRVKYGKAPVESPAVQVWPLRDTLTPQDGLHAAMAWKHLNKFGPAEGTHDPAPCLNAGMCLHPVVEATATEPEVTRKKASKKASKKVQPVVPEVVLSTFEQDLADLDALMADL